MLHNFFHRWERRLASVDNNRVTRPFEWGLEWLPRDGSMALRADGTGPDRPSETDPHATVLGWTDAAVADSDRFFTAPPTTDYVVEANGATSPTESTVTFPSAFVTPDPANNIVYARYFCAAPGKGARRAVVVLPQWNADEDGHVALCRLMTRFGLSALRMSLPYHDRRRPPDLDRADYIVSSNVLQTVQVCRQAVVDARRAVEWLVMQGYERIGILGTSLGSCLAMLTASHEPRIRAQALNHISPFFADVVWHGLSTAHVRAGLEGSIDLDTLRRAWAPISPLTYLERTRDKQTLLVYARYDLSFPVDLSRWLVQEFKTRAIPHRVAVLPCGHYSTGATPFKYADAAYLIGFLRRAL